MSYFNGQSFFHFFQLSESSDYNVFAVILPKVERKVAELFPR